MDFQPINDPVSVAGVSHTIIINYFLLYKVDSFRLLSL